MAKNKLKKIHGKGMEKLFAVGASVIEAADEILDELVEIGVDGREAIFDVGAGIVTFYDKTADVVTWLVSKTFILIIRRAHDGRLKVHKYRRELAKYGIGALIVATGIIALFASITDYEYSYNGRTLGIVKDQQDVLAILELVSEELSQEYGSDITIDPEADITFTPVLSYGKQIDDADTVLRKFTYMGDIQAQAYGIYADGQLIAVVESEEIANEVLDRIKADYVEEGDNTEYEYIGFAEEVVIEQYNTALSNVTSENTAYNRIKSGGQEEVTYEVESGDTLSSICEKLDVSLSELMEMNPELEEEDTIHIGDEFVISQEIPLLTVETIEVSTYAERIEYETVYRDSDNYYEGEEVVSQEGENGRARVTARLTRHNGVIVERDVLEEEVLQEAVDEIIIRGTREVPPTYGTGNLIRPVNVAVYSGYGWRWGRMHYGIDLSAPTGTPIRAADGGTVTLAGWYYGYGYTVIIDHGNGMTTLYGHCSALYVSAGDKVYQGQNIAAVGNTGNSTGPHCHFEVKVNGSNVNPSNYV